MSLLENLPHTVDALRQERTRDSLGGHNRVWVVFATSLECFVQRRSNKEDDPFQARQQTKEYHVYFKDDPGLREGHAVRFVDEASEVKLLEIIASEDAGVNLSKGPFRLRVREMSQDVDSVILSA